MRPSVSTPVVSTLSTPVRSRSSTSEEPVSMDTPLNLAKSCNEVAFKMATFSFANQYTFLNRTTNESLTFSCEEVKTVTAFF